MYKCYLLQILSCTGRTLQIGTPQPEQYWKQSDLSLHPAENNRKLKLADALEVEKNQLPEYNVFGDRNDKSGYEDAIKFLKTGVKPYNYEDNELLYMCAHDFETICKDYGID